jgi:transposase
MLRPIDRTRRDSPLYPGSARTLRDFIDPKHLLLKIDTNFDFASLIEFLQERYSPHLGRPAIHPEVLIRALLLSAIYNVPSYRQLVERIGENLAWRWFCHLALEDEVFDHSTITVFIERIGPESFQSLLARLNQELLRIGLLSTRAYVDSSLVRASAGTGELSPSELPPKQFRARARREQGGFTLCERAQETEQLTSIRFSRYQDEHGRLALSHVDPDARWAKVGKRPAVLGYKEHLVVDRSGFILARGVTPANASDTAGLEVLLDQLPLSPRSLCGDSGYRSLRLRFLLRRRGIEPCMPLHPQEMDSSSLLETSFSYHGDHLTCPAGSTLKIRGLPDSKDVVHYLAPERECRSCQLKASCLAPKERAKCVAASRYHFELPRARRSVLSRRFAREMARRKTAVEGVFAHLDQLAFDEARLRTTGKVDVQGSIAALAHNILKALTKRRFWRTVAAFGHAPLSPTPRPGSSHSILAPLFPIPISPPSPDSTHAALLFQQSPSRA